ncbi:MAG: M20/M25/M40 family metallo-hydrolase [Lachnospiraceae bacterium]|nr:M20/M25/M40 family metallo-hydrolase [Lachnospiraceae bacterium]
MRDLDSRDIRSYVLEHASEAEILLKELAVIPAPSGREGRRADFCRKWLEARGCRDVYVDDAGNVIYPYQVRQREKILAFMAHMDVVFEDDAYLQIRQKDRKLTGPGVGDDTANLANLMMAAAYFAEKQPDLQTGILFVMDTCEEGMGNLKGSRQIVNDFGSRLMAVIALDLYQGDYYTSFVGSCRWEIRVTAEGGHSYMDFGRSSAVEQISRIVCRLYEQKTPVSDRRPAADEPVVNEPAATYNVGMISGGTSVNTIAQEAKALYEVRSVDAGALTFMKEQFLQIIDAFRQEGMQIDLRLVGERPCAGEVDGRIMEMLGRAAHEVIAGSGLVPRRGSISSDSNIPVSMGIPSITLGTIIGGGAHTRQEWVDLDSQRTGISMVLHMIGRVCSCFF